MREIALNLIVCKDGWFCKWVLEAPWHWTSKAEFPSKNTMQLFFFFFSQHSIDLVFVSHQMKTTCWGLSVLVFSVPIALYGKGKPRTVLFCTERKICNHLCPNKHPIHQFKLNPKWNWINMPEPSLHRILSVKNHLLKGQEFSKNTWHVIK